MKQRRSRPHEGQRTGVQPGIETTAQVPWRASRAIALRTPSHPETGDSESYERPRVRGLSHWAGPRRLAVAVALEDAVIRCARPARDRKGNTETDSQHENQRGGSQLVDGLPPAAPTLPKGLGAQLPPRRRHRAEHPSSLQDDTRTRLRRGVAGQQQRLTRPLPQASDTERTTNRGCSRPIHTSSEPKGCPPRFLRTLGLRLASWRTDALLR